MDYFFYSIILALSLSLDSFGIGASYGIKKIKIPIISMLTMSIITFIFSFSSVSIGKILSIYLSELSIRILSFVLLLLLAVSMLIPTQPSKKENQKIINKQRRIFSLFIKRIGITITIIKEPLKGDQNNSKIIEFKEAICIGTALSLDALCACIGFFQDKADLLLPLLIAGFQFTFMYIGEKIGKHTTHIPGLCKKIISYIPPLILFVIAMSRLI